MTEEHGLEPARGRRAAEVRLTDETIAYLESRSTAAVSKGIKGAQQHRHLLTSSSWKSAAISDLMLTSYERIPCIQLTNS